ncbi:MAG: SLC13 family permease [Desulfotalea sp.]
MNLWIVSIILLVTLYLLVSEKISIDLTAIGIMVLLVVFQILTPREAVSGFGNPALITVAAMFIVSKGMIRTGGIEFLGRSVIKVAKANLTAALVLILFSVAIASAFINNTPVVILFIPVVMAMCCELKLSPSRFLIPISYASILAGTCTLIGTSTNIIISDLSFQYGYERLTMFELSIVGVPIAVCGILFLLVAAPRILPDLASPACLTTKNQKQYLAEIIIGNKSRHINKKANEIFKTKYPDIEVVELIKDDHVFHPERDEKLVRENCILLIKGSLSSLVGILHEDGISLPSSEKGLLLGAQKDPPIVVEIVVSPGSSTIGQPLHKTEIANDANINIIAVKRNTLHISERNIRDVNLKIGDTLLIWCEESKLPELKRDADFLLTEDVYEEIVHKRKAWWSIINFACMIGTASLGIADIMTCALTAAFLMIITGCIQMRDAYRSIQGDVLLLIAGTIALGVAMQKTGVSDLYAKTFLNLFEGFSPTIILGGMMVLTSISTQILSNNATAVLLFPIAVSTAISIGVDPKPFIVGVCIGASACFATPLGYQTNLMVFVPGGYSFKDYMRLGIPLNIFVVLAGTILIPQVWPF